MPGSEIFVLFMLASVALALLLTATYAVVGKPSTQAGKQRQKHIIRGFQLTGGVLLGFVLVTALTSGIGVAFFGNFGRFSSRPLAVVLILASIIPITLMAQRWAKYFAGWIGYGVLNGLLMISSGHLVNNPAIPIRRSLAILMTAIIALTTLVCRRFTEDYRLNVIDRAALVGWLVLFAIAANADKYGFTALSLGFLGLAVAWFYNKLSTRSKHSVSRRHIATSR